MTPQSADSVARKLNNDIRRIKQTSKPPKTLNLEEVKHRGL